MIDMRKKRIRKKQQKTGKREYVIYSIGIPAEIASKIPADMPFSVELTEEGLLFRPDNGDKQPPVTLPKWLAAGSI